MRIVVFTGSAVRHKFVANKLTKNNDDALVICECVKNDSEVSSLSGQISQKVNDHFYQRHLTEKQFFRNNDFFIAKTLPLLQNEVNLEYVFSIVKGFNPDMMFCFGAPIIKEPLLSLLPKGNFVNLHLGISPYYRGSGTNFWPFINKELEYIGATLLHIDAGIDTGDIIAHIRPDITPSDNVHTLGCKVITKSADALIEIMRMVKSGKKLNRVKQWEVPSERYYRKNDFNEQILFRYHENLVNGVVEDFLKSPVKNQLKLVSL